LWIFTLLKTIRDFEDLQDVRNFDLVKSTEDEIIPIEQAFFNEIQAGQT
jgi:hypothetical protein